ncbi:alpha/beta-hydrolase [Hyaloscypha bicolor E]|uniref:Alpha/beta-hydrolase n=1 Tax=Hyaloscypha bicolor E TaxID=1095630 RepID=A0A2J6TRH0_9HELO|nr:alpha/beta-hydrolase [Hyaloscypha bicolor E]PMD65623.1 alpha/beta-hydrolase [Hyaloscypha bicolor E]
MASIKAGEGHRGCSSNPITLPSRVENQQSESHKPKKDTLGKFPDPMIVLPQLEHRQTIIILHGRGSYAAKFGPPLLETKVDGQTLQTVFPHAKIIFPTATKEKATIYKNPTHQWFDNWHLEDYTRTQHLMVDGLNKSCRFIHGLLEAEIEAVGKENVVLWGLSQGCATSLASLLVWDGKPFAAVVGMCGWIPFGNELVKIGRGHGDKGLEEDHDDPFALSGDEYEDPFAASDYEDEARGDPPLQAVKFLRESIEMDYKKDMVFQEIPVFLGHGAEDEKVDIKLGREAKNALDLMGTNVQMKEYEGLGHWYSEDLLRDIFNFIKEKVKVEVARE